MRGIIVYAHIYFVCSSERYGYKMLKHVEIFTDGACKGNPGRGGWGAILKYGKHEREMSGGYLLTTNNRMEITAVTQALSALKEPCRVTLYSDSKYVIDALSLGWAEKWKQNGWKRGNKEKALNPDLWDRLLNEASRHEIEYVWVKGHAGHPENERCDALAVSACDAQDAQKDTGYIE